jgi:hypothetical protein
MLTTLLMSHVHLYDPPLVGRVQSVQNESIDWIHTPPVQLLRADSSSFFPSRHIYPLCKIGQIHRGCSPKRLQSTDNPGPINRSSPSSFPSSYTFAWHVFPPSSPSLLPPASPPDQPPLSLSRILSPLFLPICRFRFYLPSSPESLPLSRSPSA